MKISIKSWFTLIEFAVSITVFFVLALATYAPYSYYSNKIRLKQSIKEIVQTLYDARNMAINWAIWENWLLISDKNLSVWVYFDIRDNKKLKLIFYPYDVKEVDIIVSWSNIKTYNLQKGIQIDNINWSDNLLFFFKSITWDVKYYKFDSYWVKREFSWNEINMNVSYKWTSSPNLKKKITYFTNTNIVDY